MYDISVAIVNYNMKDDIDKCLSSFFADIKGSGLDCVVNVIDNSANMDNIKELLESKYPQVKYYKLKKNVGFGRGQNIGLKKTQARFYLPLNPDSEFLPNSNTIKKLVDFLEKREDIGIVGPKLLNQDCSVQLSCCRFPLFFDQIIRRLHWEKGYKYFRKRVDYYLMRDFDHDETVPVDWIIGSFMLMRREVVQKIGFFDSRFFMYFEDCDLCRRSWQAGWKVYYVYDIALKHTHRRQSAKMSPFIAFFKNHLTRVHIKSWLLYSIKWRFKKEHYGI